jgi:hypothetical protein
LTYGVTDTIDCGSPDERCRVVTVTHSPGFTACTAVAIELGARNLMVT